MALPKRDNYVRSTELFPGMLVRVGFASGMRSWDDGLYPAARAEFGDIMTVLSIEHKSRCDHTVVLVTLKGEIFYKIFTTGFNGFGLVYGLVDADKWDTE